MTSVAVRASAWDVPPPLAEQEVRAELEGLAAELAHEVIEERELLAHERAVDRVLAGDLGQQAAQPRRARSDWP